MDRRRRQPGVAEPPLQHAAGSRWFPAKRWWAIGQPEDRDPEDRDPEDRQDDQDPDAGA